MPGLPLWGKFPKRGRAGQAGCSLQGVNLGPERAVAKGRALTPADKIPEPPLMSLVPCRTGRVPCRCCSTSQASPALHQQDAPHSCCQHCCSTVTASVTSVPSRLEQPGRGHCRAAAAVVASPPGSLQLLELLLALAGPGIAALSPWGQQHGLSLLHLKDVQGKDTAFQPRTQGTGLGQLNHQTGAGEAARARLGCPSPCSSSSGCPCPRSPPLQCPFC